MDQVVLAEVLVLVEQVEDEPVDVDVDQLILLPALLGVLESTGVVFDQVEGLQEEGVDVQLVFVEGPVQNAFYFQHPHHLEHFLLLVQEVHFD